MHTRAFKSVKSVVNSMLQRPSVTACFAILLRSICHSVLSSVPQTSTPDGSNARH